MSNASTGPATAWAGHDKLGDPETTGADAAPSILHHAVNRATSTLDDLAALTAVPRDLAAMERR